MIFRKKIGKAAGHVLIAGMFLFFLQICFGEDIKPDRMMNTRTYTDLHGLTRTILSDHRSPLRYALTNKSQTAGIEANPFKYSGYYQDAESGMYYLNARYYSPELMRFISRDTYDLSNRYAYCDGNPVLNADPNGHISNWVRYTVSGILATAAIGGVGAFALDCLGNAIGRDCAEAVSLAFGDIGRPCERARSTVAAAISSEDGIELQSLAGIPSCFSQMDKASLRSYMLKNGIYLGKGEFGEAYQYNEYVYKIFTGMQVESNKTDAEACAEIINSLTCNREASFTAHVTGRDNDVLVMPFAEGVGNGVTVDQTKTLKQFCKERDGIYIDDLNPANAGYYNGRLIVFDVDFAFRQDCNRTKWLVLMHPGVRRRVEKQLGPIALPDFS
jgi:RHS repeat-associated protein